MQTENDCNGDMNLNEEKETEPATTEDKSTAKRQLWEILKFTGFSISAGVIQLLSFSILYEWAKCLAWWPSYLISIILSVIWNFTFNRKFTFKAANSIPLAMTLVIIYYCAFIPVSVFGGNALEKVWGEKYGILVTVLMMLINFVTEFAWDKFIVFNQKITDKLLQIFKKPTDKAN